MKRTFWLTAALIVVLAACQSKSIRVTILDGGNVLTLTTTERLPKNLLALAKISIGANDRVFYLGSPTPLDVALPDAAAYSLTVRRAVAVILITPAGTQNILTSASTVGQALMEAGLTLFAADRLDPPAETPISGPLTVTYQPANELTVTVDGIQLKVRSAAGTIGQALAAAGLPLVGLDYTVPAESDPLPADGQVRVVRVVESVALTQKSLPFKTRTELSADLELDQQALLQGGEPGLAISRLRTRTEDGTQVSQKVESESIVRPPQDRIMGYGTKIVIRTTTVDGQVIEYWRALSLAITSYSPCRSGASRCYPSTSLGTPVRHGEVAMVLSWWKLLAHERVYVPGYGEAIVEDVGGGYPAGNHYWVDLGWTDDEYQNITYEGGYTVYFLTPVPANVANMYIMP
jgi:uncharacterized protein YabE (DUF348 family)